MHYYTALNDLHNFWLPIEDYRDLFRQEFLNSQLPLDNFDLNNVYYEKQTQVMNYHSRIAARERVDTWKERWFPETRQENIKILNDYLELCDKKNILPIMFLPTVSEGYAKLFNSKMLDELRYLIRAAIKNHPRAVFFDGWMYQNYFSDSDFSDVDHMNPQGAAKFSFILNDFIERLKK